MCHVIVPEYYGHSIGFVRAILEETGLLFSMKLSIIFEIILHNLLVYIHCVYSVVRKRMLSIGVFDKTIQFMIRLFCCLCDEI